MPPETDSADLRTSASGIWRTGWRGHGALALASAVLIGLQLALMGTLSNSLGHHLAYVVISLSLLGFGASGTFLFLWQAGTGIPAARLFFPAILLLAPAIAWLPHLLVAPLGDLTIELLREEPTQWLRLLLLGVIVLLPFFLGAAAIGCAFTAGAERIGGIYAANLGGSAAGALGALGLLHLLLPESLFTGFAAAAWVAALIALPRGRGPILALAAAALLSAAPAFLGPADPPRSSYKDISRALLLPDAQATPAQPHPMGRMETVASPAMRHAPDLSLRFTGHLPTPPSIFIDGDGAGVLLRANDVGANAIEHTPEWLPHALLDSRHTLLLAPGGTPSILRAVAAGSSAHVVESHPQVASAMAATLKETAAARIVPGISPRALLSRGHAGLENTDIPQPDLIVFPGQGAFGGLSGLHAIGEDFLATSEAVASALDLLAPGGLLAFHAWLDEPPRRVPRLVNLAAAGLQAHGAEQPGPHLAMLRGWGSVALAASPEPLTAEQIGQLERFAQSAGFDILWPPPKDDQTRELLHSDADDILIQTIAGLLGPDAEQLRREHPFAIHAPTDNHPFASQFLRPGEIPGAFASLFRHDPRFTQLSMSELAPAFLLAVLALLTLASLLLILAPMLLTRTKDGPRSFTLPYFAGLGAGFMFLEIALIQRLTLVWGSPVHSAAAVITAVLLGMGIGSALSRNLAATRRNAFLATLGVALLALCLLAAAAPATRALLELPHSASFAAGLTLLAIPAILLGIPFPIGLRLLKEHAENHIPWAWSINGFLSVLSATAAGLFAMTFGFSFLPVAAALAYSLAAAATLTLPRG